MLYETALPTEFRNNFNCSHWKNYHIVNIVPNWGNHTLIFRSLDPKVKKCEQECPRICLRTRENETSSTKLQVTKLFAYSAIIKRTRSFSNLCGVYTSTDDKRRRCLQGRNSSLPCKILPMHGTSYVISDNSNCCSTSLSTI